MNAKILIVDDSKTDRMIISNILSDCELICACDGVEAMELINANLDLDIIILDLNMPRMNGFEVLEAINHDPIYSKMVTIILTNYDETENEIRGLDLGAVDYIRKPLNIESLRKRIEVHLNLRSARKSIEQQNQVLEETVSNRTRELVITRDITIHALIGLLEVRNIESSNHTKRTQWMMKELCEQLKKKHPYIESLTDDYITELFKTAPLHDIGKVGIPDNILLKPGKLDKEEFEIMKKHTTYGVEALSHELHSGDVPIFIQTAIEVAGTHHECFDGSGYPSGLKGKEIPLPGRLMTIVDVYDAITSQRVYKPAFDHDYALDFIRSESGKKFDPEIVIAFIEIERDILNISHQFIQNIPEEE
ncbi:MAG: two-component system response regulator [Firmicutes bacterium HGW-Firmicutes-1]|jgi:putative two-component system response regulator|nr:MAG: two-component system response regulator [Firmicutes bacterium HGW-Firmicutes-1]